MARFRSEEIATCLFMHGKPFIAEEWEFDPVTMYFKHKTEGFTHEDSNGKREIPYMLSARTVHKLLSA